MARSGEDPKVGRLREERCLNPRPEAVVDERFRDSEFFDPRDLVQVKYEMVRRARVEGDAIARAVESFGSRARRFMPRRPRWMRVGLLVWCRPDRAREGRTS